MSNPQEEWRWDPQTAKANTHTPVPPAQEPFAESMPPDMPPDASESAVTEPTASDTPPATDMPPNAPMAQDPQKPLWQAVIGPMTPIEWKAANRRIPFGWCYALCLILALYLSITALAGPLEIGDMLIPRGRVFVPLHLAFLGLSLVGYFAFQHRRQRKEQLDFSVYHWIEGAGRTVMVYSDRVESVGLHDTVTVPFEGAVLREWRDLLTVEKDGARVWIRAVDITAEETASLTALLYPRVCDCRGKHPFYGLCRSEQRRLEPHPKHEEPQFATRVTYTRAAAAQRRLMELFGEQWRMWLPLIALTALMITDGWSQGNSNLLYYSLTLLSVLVLSVVLMAVGVLCGTYGDRALPKSLELQFYSDRLVVKTPRKTVVCLKGLLALQLDDTHLTIATPLQRWELPLKDVQDAAALRGFLTDQNQM